MAATSGEPDMAYIGELYENISRHPPAISARILLIEHYISVGNEWLDGALDEAKKLKAVAPTHPDLPGYLKLLEKNSGRPAPEKRPVSVITASVNEISTKDGHHKTTIVSKSAYRRSAVPAKQQIEDLDDAQHDLTTGYRNVRARATSVIGNLFRLQALQKKAGHPQSRNLGRIQSIADESKSASASRAHAQGSARAVARRIRDNPEKATEFVIVDLEESMSWLSAPDGKPVGASNDEIREALVKRRAAIESTLPDELKVHCELGFMHVEHENLDRNYVNKETMLGDEVKDIPRADFYVTEDNYAWDMSELVQAIQANSGVLRNPLSKAMFTPKDIKGILMHPSGKPLAALQVQQHELSKGVRTETIVQMDKLSKILLDDQSSDAIPSREAVDEFLLYVATLPDFEQKAIAGLKCPAKDSHTGQAYDWSIGEAVRDAKGNLVCFHKTGDFIRQAAAYLRKNQGVAPDLDANNCKVM
ncbi:hypothetical protein BDW02DRAFT_356582 [Decorospora gaudefroyi]|uniref:Uncharacterized protein n=1 Tax=Decorospora gaudefroyi TaxID=184978 RepID=A0A6A5KKB7_9PLEO|nr:hypothetical protein BDW02DRAFT_356582 [Decorospora gaudefroyi]